MTESELEKNVFEIGQCPQCSGINKINMDGSSCLQCEYHGRPKNEKALTVSTIKKWLEEKIKKEQSKGINGEPWIVGTLLGEICLLEKEVKK